MLPSGSAIGRSCASPPVRIRERRRPLASAIAWIVVLRPPRDRPIACSPLFHRRAARLDVSRINHLPAGRSSATGKFLKQSLPNPALGPAYKPVVNRCRRPMQSHQRQPLFSTCKMPLSTRRSSTRILPRTSVGKSGPIFAHWSSDNQNKFRRMCPSQAGSGESSQSERTVLKTAVAKS